MNEQRAHDVVSHLQTAALEVIAAARAFLDVAEELVKDPGEAAAMATALADFAHLGNFAGRSAPPEDPPPGVERIRIS